MVGVGVWGRGRGPLQTFRIYTYSKNSLRENRNRGHTSRPRTPNDLKPSNDTSVRRRGRHRRARDTDHRVDYGAVCRISSTFPSHHPRQGIYTVTRSSLNGPSCMFVFTRGSAGFARRGLLAAALALRLRFPRPTIQTQLNTLQRFGLPPPPGGALGPRRLGAVYIHQSRCPLPTASASRRVAVAAARWAALFDSPPRLLRPHRALRLAAFTCDT